MTMDRSNFFGLWTVRSGLMTAELLLHEDGTYGESAWGGVEQHWGVWQLEDRGGQPVMVLQVQGGYPPTFLGPFGPGPVAEVHAVLNVGPNRIQLYDALMERQFVPATPQQQPYPEEAAGFPATAAGSSWQNAYFQMPIMPPVPTYSAPPPPPPPPMQAAPIMDHWKTLNDELAKQVRDTVIQTYKDDRQTDTDIQKAKAAEDLYEFNAREDTIRDANDAMHKQAEAVVDGMRTENALRRF